MEVTQPSKGDSMIQERIIIKCPPASVFKFVADFRNLPEFCLTSDSVQQTYGAGPAHGAKYLQVFKMPIGKMKTPVEIVEYDEPRTLVYQAYAGPKVRGKVQFKPTAEGTELLYDLWLTAGGMFALMKPLFSMFLAKQTRGDLIKLKALLENRS
jgi:uncharacterized protein YndB with AHSA1/START domain